MTVAERMRRGGRPSTRFPLASRPDHDQRGVAAFPGDAERQPAADQGGGPGALRGEAARAGTWFWLTGTRRTGQDARVDPRGHAGIKLPASPRQGGGSRGRGGRSQDGRRAQDDGADRDRGGRHRRLGRQSRAQLRRPAGRAARRAVRQRPGPPRKDSRPLPGGAGRAHPGRVAGPAGRPGGGGGRLGGGPPRPGQGAARGRQGRLRREAAGPPAWTTPRSWCASPGSAAGSSWSATCCSTTRRCGT